MAKRKPKNMADQDLLQAKLYVAVRSLDPEKVVRAIKQGADPNALYGPGPLIHNCPLVVTSEGLTQATLRNYICQLLLLGGANPNATGEDGATAMHGMACWGNTDGVKLLLEFGGNIEAKDLSGATPLRWAVEGDALATIEFMSEQGADPWTKSQNGLNPFERAIEKGHGMPEIFLRRCVAPDKETCRVVIQLIAEHKLKPPALSPVLCVSR